MSVDGIKHLVAWTEWQERTVMTPKGAVFANKGEVVIVVVADDLPKALSALLLAKQEPRD